MFVPRGPPTGASAEAAPPAGTPAGGGAVGPGRGSVLRERAGLARGHRGQFAAHGAWSIWSPDHGQGLKKLSDWPRRRSFLLLKQMPSQHLFCHRQSTVPVLSPLLVAALHLCPVPQTRKLRLREGKEAAQRDTARERHGQGGAQAWVLPSGTLPPSSARPGERGGSEECQ